MRDGTVAKPDKVPAAEQRNQEPAPVQKLKRRPRLYYDFSLLCALIFAFVIGLIVLYSASQYLAARSKDSDYNAAFYFVKQACIGGAGLGIAIFMSLFDYRILKRKFLLVSAYVVAVGLPIVTLIIGIASHGKTRWLEIGPFSIQTAEVVKAALIVFLASYIAKRGTNMNKREEWLKFLALAFVPAALIGKENVSSGIIILMIAMIMLFVAVDHYKTFMALLAAAFAAVIGLKPLIHQFIVTNGIISRPDNYLLRRIVGWAAPEIFTADSYQTQQAIYAIGSGGIMGQGLGNSIQKYGSIPEVWNDMTFSIACEEFGFIGAAAIIIMYLYIIYRIYNIAVNARDLFGTMICTGVMAHLSLQVVLNIAVVTGVIPNTGVTLPFMSYGGTAILMTMLEFGLVLSVALRIKV